MANPLTPDQREVWDEEGMGDRPTVPSGQQTIEQALNFRAAEFRHICRLDGVEPPSEETIREALRAGVGQ